MLFNKKKEAFYKFSRPTKGISILTLFRFANFRIATTSSYLQREERIRLCLDQLF